MRLKNIIIMLLSSLVLISCGNEKSTENRKEESNATVEESNEGRHEGTFYDYFDTVTTFLVYTKDDEEYENYKKLLEDELDKYHKLYNTYDSFEGVNNFKTINDNAGIEPVKVDPEIIELIDYSKDMYVATDGKINIALGSLLELWHDYREMSLDNPNKAAIPTEEELEERSAHQNIDSIVVDEENSTVYIDDPNVRIDIGAIGKGFATKKIADHLKNAGVKSGIISVGGDDVIIGKNPAKENGKRKIAIQNPFVKEENPYASVVDIENTSVVTSGDYQRFFTVDGVNYHHIIDPETMYPSKYRKSVSVVIDDIALADTLSTYLFIIDHDKGEEVAKKYNADVLWISPDGERFKTEGWDKIEDKEN